MVINFTNIINSKNYLSSQIFEHKKKPRHTLMQIEILAWDRYKIVSG